MILEKTYHQKDLMLLKKFGGKEKKLPTDTLAKNQPPKMTLTFGCSCL